jgi:hypothetical protein
MIEKNYQPADIETRMSRLWESSVQAAARLARGKAFTM